MAIANTVEYVQYIIELRRQLESMKKAVLSNDYQSAFERSLQVQVEAKLLTNALSTWIKEEQNERTD